MTDTIKPAAPPTERAAQPARLWIVYGALACGVLVILIVVGLIVHARRPNSEDADQTLPETHAAMAPGPTSTMPLVIPPAATAAQPSDSVAPVADSAPSQAAKLTLNDRVAALEAKVASLSAHPESAAVSPGDLQALAQRVQTLEGALPQVNSLDGKLRDVHQALNDVKAQAHQLAAQSRFQHDIEALRRDYPGAASAALAASRPERTQHSFWKRLLMRIEALVVVRRGDQILVGDPAVGPLHAAQSRLDESDLQGALKALDRLEGAAAIAMQTWIIRARAVMAEATAAP